jgi:C-terminal processing protease CtpA/Prc
MKKLILPLLFAALPAFAQFGPPKDFTVTAAERDQVIKGAIAKLNENYVFPDVARKMGDAVSARAAKGEYASITTAKALADKLTADFREVSHDKHLHMEYSENGFPEGEAHQPNSDFMSKINFGFEKVERMRGNVGYIDIRGFVPPAFGGETATAAMSFIANTDALIVDLRQNGGGEPDMIAYVLSYLFDEPTHVNDIYTRTTNDTQQWWTSGHVAGLRYGGKKPVYVLTSGRTFSGGEEFAYDLKNLKRATLIGETTGGGAHPVQPYKVSEHFAVGVPFARAISPVTKTNWEGVGVPPDVAVIADTALDKAYRLALEDLLGKTSDPERKAAIQRLLDQKKS